MYISRKLKEQSISEYLLYMWQVEDMIRANGCDVDKLAETVVAAYDLPEEQRAELTEWYANLVEMMHLEGWSRGDICRSTRMSSFSLPTCTSA